MTNALFRRQDRRAVLWHSLEGLTDHSILLEAMHNHVANMIAGGNVREEVWLVECPPGYSAGGDAKPEHRKEAEAAGLGVDVVPVVGARRGGSYSYHGPGVRLAIVMLDLRTRRKDMAGYAAALQHWVQGALDTLGIKAAPAKWDPAGLWIGEEKIAAVGLRVRQWVTSYGVALYVAPDLKNFDGIVQCGLAGKGVTSIAAQRPVLAPLAMAEADVALRKSFETIFGPTSLVT